MKVFSPAKLNLSLAVTGRRADGFHSLVSLVVPLEFGDTLVIEEREEAADVLSCDQDDIPLGPENLILKALALFRRKTGVERYFSVALQKRIPAGGGFGGGSGNAVCALKAFNEICGNPEGERDLREMAEELGSDCPLFLYSSPVIIRGRGEDVTVVPGLDAGLGSRCVHLFNPGFASPTGNLFRKMSERGGFTPSAKAEEAIQVLIESIRAGGPFKGMTNDLGSLLEQKYLVYESLFSELRENGIFEYGITGSGSGAFILSRSRGERDEVHRILDPLLDRGRFIIETRFGGLNSKDIPKPSL